MAWSRDKVDSSNINNGNEYVKGDRVSRQALNSMVNSGLYSQDFVEALADTPIVENDETGASPSVELVDNIKNGKTYKKFKFKNLGSGSGTNENTLTTDDLIKTFDIEEQYNDRQIYNANAIHELMAIFGEEITMRDEIVEGKAEKDASNLDATNITQWQTKLNVATQQDIEDAKNLAGNYIDAEIQKIDEKKPDTRDVERVLGELHTAYMEAINGNTDRIETLEENSATKIEVQNAVNNAGNYIDSQIATVNQKILKLDDEKADKEGVLTELSNTLNEAKGYTDTKVAALVNGAPETLDTLDELAAALKDNKDIVDTLNAAIGNKANQSDLNETNSTVSSLANTVKEHTFALVNKVDKKSNSTSYNQIYAVLPTQEQKTIPATDENIANSIVMRDENGKIQASTPVADNDVVNKYYVDAIDSKKVDKVSGKGLSTKDYTEGDKLKLDSIEWGAEENVQSDWNVTDTTSKAFIKNKPVIPQGSVLYDSTGQNTNGAMTQKATTDALSSKADKTELEKKLNLSGGVITGDLTLESLGDQSLSNRLKFNTRNNNSPSIGYATDKADGTFLITSGLNYKRQADGLSFDGTSGELLWKNVRVATINDIPTDYVTETELTNKDYATSSDLANKVDKVSGKGLSTNDFTSGYKTKLDGIEPGANKTVVDSALSTTSINPVQNAIITSSLNNKANTSNVSKLVTDYTLSSASSSINLTGLNLINDGGVYDVIVVYKTSAGTDTYVTVNNITSNSYKSFTLACYGNSKTATSVGNVSLNKFQAGSIHSTNEGTLSFTLIQNSTSSAQYLFKAIDNDGSQLYYRDGGGYVSLSSSITSIQISTGSPIQAGARIRIYARAK